MAVDMAAEDIHQRAHGRNLACVVAMLLVVTLAGRVEAQRVDGSVTAVAPRDAWQRGLRSDRTPADVLSPAQWERVNRAADRALVWLASQQQSDGSFPTLDLGQPGVTCLCTLAFMAHGHLPDEGPYGERLKRATEYALRCQKPSGLVTLLGPEGVEISRNISHEIGNAASYNHGIASLTLSELYGTTRLKNEDRLKRAILRSLRVTLEMQRWPKDRAIDNGGWRYIDDFNHEDSDLSITGWQLMFLRSARNAGFDVPKQSIDDAVAYVRRTYSQQYGAFMYAAGDADHRSRGMAGAGILALAHAGYHDSPEAQQSGNWILQYPFDQYNTIEPFTQGWKNDRYHYGLFNCCQAMYQLGGRYWEAFFPRTVAALLANQQADGSWPVESHHHDAQFGNAYTTALVLLTLGAPNQLLPIYQR
jgi:hypothetical protein